MFSQNKPKQESEIEEKLDPNQEAKNRLKELTAALGIDISN